MTHLDTEGIKSVLISTSKSYICAFSLFNTIFFIKLHYHRVSCHRSQKAWTKTSPHLPLAPLQKLGNKEMQIMGNKK